MIVDHLSNAFFYKDLGSNFRRAFKYLKKQNLSKLNPGSYVIENNRIHAHVSKYLTHEFDQEKWESHKQFVDLQYIIEGFESFGFGEINNFEPISEYIPERDICWYKGELHHLITAGEGMFLIFFPNDIHQPGIVVDNPKEVKKIVIKIRINNF